MAAADKNNALFSLKKLIDNVLMAELGILDLWRDFHVLSNDYHFYSCPP